MIDLFSRKKRKQLLVPMLMFLPSFLLITIFVYGFIAWTVRVSFTNWKSLLPDFHFIGFANYKSLFQDFRFQSDIRNTIFFTLLFIILCLIIGILLAVLIDQKIKGEGIFRNIFIFPMALSFIVTGVVWQWVLNPTSGVNILLKKIGIDNLPNWYISTKIIPSWDIGSISFGLPVALIGVIIAAVWQMSGFTMAMFLSGLRAIPEEMKEAARVDGASEWQVFFRVILPQLKGVTASVIIILGHISLKIFDLVYAMTGPGAMFVTDMPGVYMFETTFKANNYAGGAAIATLILLVVSLLIVPYLISAKKGEN